MTVHALAAGDLGSGPRAEVSGAFAAAGRRLSLACAGLVFLAAGFPGVAVPSAASTVTNSSLPVVWVEAGPATCGPAGATFTLFLDGDSDAAGRQALDGDLNVRFAVGSNHRSLGRGAPSVSGNGYTGSSSKETSHLGEALIPSGVTFHKLTVNTRNATPTALDIQFGDLTPVGEVHVNLGGLWTTSGYSVGSPALGSVRVHFREGGECSSLADTKVVVADPVASFGTGSSSAGEGAGTQNVTVNLSKPAASAVTVDYQVGGTASSSGDFTITGSGSVTVAQGSSAGTIAVAITDDADDETSETVILTLDAGTGYTVGSPSSHTLTITDNDDPPATDPVASFATGSSSAGEGAGTQNVTVNLSKPAASAVTVDYQVGGTASSSGDFTITGSGSVTVAQGSSAGTIAVAITDDADDETSETVILTLDAGTGYTVGSPSSHTLTITDNDDPPATDPVASFATGSSSAGEGAGTQNVTVNLSKPAASAVTVDYQVGGTASSSGDFTITGSGSVTVAQGSSAGTIAVAITDDADDETSETVILTLDTGTGYTVGSPSSHTLTITDNDDPPATDPVASFATGSSSAGEGAGTQNVTVNLSKPAASAVTVDYQVGGTASSSGDFTITGSGSVTVAQGSSTGTIAVAITDDADDETSETVILTLDAGTGYTVGSPSSHTLTITDNDDPPATDPMASFSTGSSSAGEGAGTRHVPVRLSKPASSPVTVDYRVGGTASSGDFTITGGGSVTVAQGSSTGTIAVTITDDGDDETDETVVLTLDTGTGYSVGNPSSHKLMIHDDDRAPSTHGAGTGSGSTGSTGGASSNQPPTVELSCSPCAVSAGDEARVTATASDPDGDPLDYSWEATGGRLTGANRGPNVGWASPSRPGRYRIEVLVSDGQGGVASAEAVVEVIAANEGPSLDRDSYRFELPEGTAGPWFLGSITATDPNGGPVLYEPLSGDWRRFELGPEDGALIYTGPGEDFDDGPVRFEMMVRVWNLLGAHTIGQIVVEVTDVNEAPVAIGTIPTQRPEAGFAAVEVELTGYFEDPDGDVLTYRAESSDVAVVTAAVAGAVLTVTPIGPGTAVVTVTAEDPDGLSAEQVVPVGVGFGGRPEVLGESLAAMARSHLASVRMTLGRRLDRDRSDSSSRVSVMGRSLPVGEETTPEAFQGMATGWLMSAAMASRTGASGVSPFAPGSLESGAATSLGEWSGFSTGSNRLFQGTEFVMGFGGAQRDAPATERVRRFQVWGQGDLQGFSGAGSPGRAHDGDLRTGYLGVDAELGSRWLVGVAVARSAGGSDWRVDATEGRLTTTMTSALPYARWSDGVTSVWAIGGVGRGDAENSASASGRTENSDLRLGLGSVELRRAMALTVGGASFGLRADAGWAQLRTDEGTDGLSGLAVGVNQQRVGAEVSRSFEVSGGSVLPFGEVHLRRDGGEGATGSGVELAVGLRAQGGIVRLDAQGRLLVVHSADDYRERGVGLTLTVGEMGEEGLSVAVSPRWGDAARAGGALWREQLAQRSTLAFAPPLWTLETRGDYRMRLGGGLLTLFGGYSDSVMGHRLLIGGTWDPFARRIAPVDGRETRVAATPARRPASLETPTSDEPPDAPAPAEEVATEPPAEGQPSPVVIPPLPEVTSEEVAAPAPELDPAPIPAPAPPDTPPDPEEGTEEPAPPVEAETPAPVPGSPADLNQPPVFSETEYVFRSPDMRSAGPRWRRVGVVRARDPEGSPVTYSLSEGDRSRFRVDLRSGVIVRIGTSAEDPATERPDGFVLTVSARDRDGGVATVTVRVLPDRVEPGG